MNADKRPNELLTSWFARSGWSKGELARQVNRRARQLGAGHISTDTSRVRRWLDGEQPREPRGLHRVVVAHDPPADGHAQRGRQRPQPPRVLRGDDVRGRQRGAEPR